MSERDDSGGGAGAGPDPLRVLMVIQGFPPKIGGAELQLARLLPLLAERGVEATVLTRAFGGRPRRERVPGALVLRSPVAGDGPAASAAYLGTALRTLLRRRGAIDVVHAHGALSEGAVALAAARLGLPAVVKVLRAGEQGDFDLLSRRPGGALRTRLLARTASFVAISDEVREELRALGVPPERIHDVPNGVDTEAFRPADGDERLRLREELGIPAEALQVVSVGRLIEVKEVETAVRVVAALPEVSLDVVGDGPERTPLERLAVELGAGDRVRFAGSTARAADHLRAADVFVLPSRSEGLSNALLEAMACGLACVATPISGSARLLAGGRGVLVAAGDVPAWADAVGALAADPARRERLGRAAVEHVRREFSLEATADGLVEVYRGLAAAARGRR